MPLDKTILQELIQTVQAAMNVRRTFWATYRLQFQGGQFGFNKARQLADYLSDLGVSHIYSSPILKARSGSTHGYDVVDHSRLNDELGNDEDYAEYIRACQAHGLGQLMDIVPNHMSVAGDENAFWMDVLRNGPASPYAFYFDIDWQPGKSELEWKLLLPVLDDLYGNVLEAGRLPIHYSDGAFFVSCGMSLLPLDPKTWTGILEPRIDELAETLGEEADGLLELRSILTALQHLPSRTEMDAAHVAERHREGLIIQSRLRRLHEESPVITEHIKQNLNTLNGEPGVPSSFDALDHLLEDQAYRLVHWKAGSDEMNYRRFFDVTELAALCMENINVFEATHQLTVDLAAEKWIDGFRVDHIDGLFDPAQYLWRLQWAYLRALGRQTYSELSGRHEGLPDWEDVEPTFLQSMHAAVAGPDPLPLFEQTEDVTSPDERAATAESEELRGELPLFVLVEKILGVDEPLPPSWPVAGTTGYDFLNSVNGLYVDSRGLWDLERHYFRFTDEREAFSEVVYECKRLILNGPMQSEVQLLAHRLDRLSYRHRHSRDYTLLALRAALREVIACFSVYRTYIREGIVSERDQRIVHRAAAQARRRNPTTDVAVFNFVRDVLLLEQPQELDASGLTEREFFIGRFQQVTSPVMAKGVEDTSFYRYLPLTSLCEVGGEPTHAVTTVEEFHRENAARLKEWPQAMLCTTSHDTKRSEDVRARINVLTEAHGLWRKALQQWSRWNRKYRREIDGEPGPSRNDEWLFYQTLIGTWPLSPLTPEQRPVYIERLQHYMEKATHEAKLRTSWISPNPHYDEAVRHFVAQVLSDGESRFLQDLQKFHDSIIESGLYTALSQVLLKLTSPGIPDVYQGQELWDFSLVDPDNRRPVDYDRRRWLLAEIASQVQTPEGRLELSQQLGENPRDDRLKMFVTWSALQFRKAWPELLSDAEYIPLEVRGECAEHVCAFAWRSRRREETGRFAIIAVPRLLFRLETESEQSAPCGPTVWKDTALVMDDIDSVPMQNLFTGAQIEAHDGYLRLETLLENFPVALLTNDGWLP